MLDKIRDYIREHPVKVVVWVGGVMASLGYAVPDDIGRLILQAVEAVG